jgi:hypothetical protein
MVMQLKLVMTWGFLLGLPYDMEFFQSRTMGVADLLGEASWLVVWNMFIHF